MISLKISIQKIRVIRLIGFIFVSFNYLISNWYADEAEGVDTQGKGIDLLSINRDECTLIFGKLYEIFVFNV